MIGRVFRVLFGFALACLAAGLTLALFVVTPAEMYVEFSGLPADVVWERLANLGVSALLMAIALGRFAAPLAVVAIGVSEWRRIRAQAYFLLVAIAIALLGFFVQHSTETAGGSTIVNKFALAAFLTTGLVGGTVYWLASGRRAGGNRAYRDSITVKTQPLKSAVTADLAGSASPAAERSETDKQKGALDA